MSLDCPYTTAVMSNSGKRLPTEKEWEFAARGGLDKATYHWGDKHEESSFKLYNGIHCTLIASL